MAAEIPKIQAEIRATYQSDDTRQARLNELLETVRDLRKRTRLRTIGRFEVDAPETLINSVAELRATLYADERASFGEKLAADIDALRKKIAQRAAERERQALVNELSAEIKAVRDQLQKRAVNRQEALADKLAAIEQIKSREERDAAKAALQRDPTPEELAGDAELTSKIQRLTELQKTVRMRDLSTVAPDLLDDAKALQARLKANIANKRTVPLPADAKADAELRAEIAELTRIRNDLTPPIETRERSRLSAKSPELIAAEEAAEKKLQLAAEKARDDIEAKMLELTRGKLATVVDQRRDAPQSRVAAKTQDTSVKTEVKGDDDDDEGGEDDDDDDDPLDIVLAAITTHRWPTTSRSLPTEQQ